MILGYYFIPNCYNLLHKYPRNFYCISVFQLLLWWTKVKFFCYVRIAIATALSRVLCCGLVIHFILVSFVMVFSCHIYLTLRGLCFGLYNGTAHYSILKFPLFVYPLAYMFCLHYVLQVATLQTLDGTSLAELSTWD